MGSWSSFWVFEKVGYESFAVIAPTNTIILVTIWETSEGCGCCNTLVVDWFDYLECMEVLLCVGCLKSRTWAQSWSKYCCLLLLRDFRPCLPPWRFCSGLLNDIMKYYARATQGVSICSDSTRYSHCSRELWPYNTFTVPLVLGSTFLHLLKIMWRGFDWVWETLHGCNWFDDKMV